MASRRDKHCLCQFAPCPRSGSGAEVPGTELGYSLAARACPARHAEAGARARPAPRLAGHSRPTLGLSALAGRRLAAAKAGLRKASEPFAHPCAIILTQRREPDSYTQSGLAAIPRSHTSFTTLPYAYTTGSRARFLGRDHSSLIYRVGWPAALGCIRL